jgi:hypothetical protein
VDWLDLVQLALTTLGFVLLAFVVGRSALARSRAKAAPAVEARVVSVERSDGGSRMYACFVDVAFEVPGHGELTNRRGFETEGQAILWSRRYKEGSVHRVVPNSLEEGKAFVADDLKRRGGDWPMWILVAILGALVAWAAVEYWAHD